MAAGHAAAGLKAANSVAPHCVDELKHGVDYRPRCFVPLCRFLTFLHCWHLKSLCVFLELISSQMQKNLFILVSVPNQSLCFLLVDELNMRSFSSSSDRLRPALTTPRWTCRLTWDQSTRRLIMLLMGEQLDLCCIAALCDVVSFMKFTNINLPSVFKYTNTWSLDWLKSSNTRLQLSLWCWRG